MCWVHKCAVCVFAGDVRVRSPPLHAPRIHFDLETPLDEESDRGLRKVEKLMIEDCARKSDDREPLWRPDELSTWHALWLRVAHNHTHSTYGSGLLSCRLLRGSHATEMFLGRVLRGAHRMRLSQILSWVAMWFRPLSVWLRACVCMYTLLNRSSLLEVSTHHCIYS